jgi:hypothetical protein
MSIPISPVESRGVRLFSNGHELFQPAEESKISKTNSPVP